MSSYTEKSYLNKKQIKGENMTWNHRVMRHENGPISFCDDGCWYGIHEVYYDAEGNVDGWTEDALVTGDSIQDLKWALEHMLECLDKEVLEYEPEV